jgi:hypothetical protein
MISTCSKAFNWVLTAHAGISAAVTVAAARERGARERMERMRNFMITAGVKLGDKVVR